MRDWIIVKTEPGKEMSVAEEFKARNYDVWVPMDIRFYNVSRHIKTLQVSETPLIPRHVFVSMPYWTGDSSARYAKGICRDAEGFVLRITDAQMSDFMASHGAWNDRIIAANTPKLPSKQKTAMQPMTIDTLQQIKGVLFGEAVDLDLAA